MGDSGKHDQMPVGGGRLSNATDVMGMAQGKGVIRGRGRRETPNGVSAEVERTPVPVLSATLPTEDAIWIFLRQGEKRVIGSRCRHYWQNCF